MKHKEKPGSSAGTVSTDPSQQPAWKPTWAFRLTTSFLIAATVGLAIGVLALVDHYLQFVSVLYDGSDPRFNGQEVDIYYCMLSSTASHSMPSRCNYAFTVAAISLALSTGWIIHEASGRHGRKPLSHHLMGWALCWLSACWWLAAGIVLSVWTNEANQAGLPSEVQRNGLCAMAFIVAGFFSGLALLKMFQPDSPIAQKMYGRRRAKSKVASTASPAATRSPGVPSGATGAARVEGVAPAAGAWGHSDLAPATAADAV